MNLLNNFKHILIILILIFATILSIKAYADNNSLVIVYPKNNAIINANSTFFIGHTHPNAVLTINNEPVKIYDNGSFVKVFNLEKGNNQVVIESTANNNTQIKKFNIIVPKEKESTGISEPTFTTLDETLIVTDKEAPIRETPYGERLTPAKENMVLQAVGFINNHYKILLDDGNYAYIGQSTVKKSNCKKIQNQILKEIEISENGQNIIIKIPTYQQTTASISNKDNLINVKLHGTTLDFKNYSIKTPYIKDFSFKDNSFQVSLSSQNINGYDYYYEHRKFVLKIKKPFESGIKDKIIAIDAGHGGKENGAMGPTEIPEKTINLAISKHLKQELEKLGAKVIMIREDDSTVDLYKRVDIAKEEDADVLISIHNNALPDGLNPYEIHGTTTYYYQPQAKILAEKIQQNLLQATEFNDLGVKKSSFVLTRPTTPVSVLVEIGFMINPYEYEKLLLPKYQRQYAIGIVQGLEEYFK